MVKSEKLYGTRMARDDDPFEWLSEVPPYHSCICFSHFILIYRLLNFDRPILITPARAPSAPSHSHRRRIAPRRVAVVVRRPSDSLPRPRCRFSTPRPPPSRPARVAPPPTDARPPSVFAPASLRPAIPSAPRPCGCPPTCRIAAENPPEFHCIRLFVSLVSLLTKFFMCCLLCPREIKSIFVGSKFQPVRKGMSIVRFQLKFVTPLHSSKI